MIQYVTGNLLQAQTEALVNTVNTVGIMSKGIALQFKERYKQNLKLYLEACKDGTIDIGKLLVVKESSIEGEKYIVNFPTKTTWKKKSEYQYIEEGLKDLLRIIDSYDLKSIAIPPLGCGNGGLEWDRVKVLIENYLGHLSIDIIVYQPNDDVKAILQKEQIKKDVNLTAPRAMLLYALAKYEERGEIASVFAANKIAYFLQISGEPLQLTFIPYTYGPYDQRVEKVLYALNGKYLSGLEQLNAKPFESLYIKYENFKDVKEFVDNKLSKNQKERLDNVFRLIKGFESTLSLEILSSIHFLLNENNKLTKLDLLEKIQSWNDRKKNLIKEEYIDIALSHLNNFGKQFAMA